MKTTNMRKQGIAIENQRFAAAEPEGKNKFPKKPVNCNNKLLRETEEK